MKHLGAVFWFVVAAAVGGLMAVWNLERDTSGMGSIMSGTSPIYTAALVTYAAVIVSVLWHAFSVGRVIKLLRLETEAARKLIAANNRTLDHLLGLADTINAKASITLSGNKKLIDGAEVIAADLKESHDRADSIDPATSTAGMAADAAARACKSK